MVTAESGGATTMGTAPSTGPSHGDEPVESRNDSSDGGDEPAKGTEALTATSPNAENTSNGDEAPEQTVTTTTTLPEASAPQNGDEPEETNNDSCHGDEASKETTTTTTSPPTNASEDGAKPQETIEASSSPANNAPTAASAAVLVELVPRPPPATTNVEPSPANNAPTTNAAAAPIVQRPAPTTGPLPPMMNAPTNAQVVGGYPSLGPLQARLMESMQNSLMSRMLLLGSPPPLPPHAVPGPFPPAFPPNVARAAAEAAPPAAQGNSTGTSTSANNSAIAGSFPPLLAHAAVAAAPAKKSTKGKAASVGQSTSASTAPPPSTFAPPRSPYYPFPFPPPPAHAAVPAAPTTPGAAKKKSPKGKRAAAKNSAEKSPKRKRAQADQGNHAPSAPFPPSVAHPLPPFYSHRFPPPGAQPFPPAFPHPPVPMPPPAIAPGASAANSAKGQKCKGLDQIAREQEAKKLRQRKLRKAAHLKREKARLKKEKDDAKFAKMYEELKEYKEKKGDCLVPHKPRTPLSIFVVEQRQQYKRQKEGKKSTLTVERLLKLTELGFVFNARPGKFLTWEERMEQCRAFVAEHGHLRIPKTHPELGAWCAKLRGYYKNNLEGAKTPLTPQRQEQLDEMGFVWLAGQRMPEASCRNRKTWEESFQLLLNWKEEHGHACVPQHDPSGLGGWVSEQRVQYKNMNRGDKTSMTAEKALKLSNVGFIWDASKNRPKTDDND